jgi:hypothetical protein
MFLVERPILKLGSTVEKNYYHLRSVILKSGISDAVLMTSDVRIAPWYLRSIPFLIFSDKEIIGRRLLMVTEWHLQGRHPSRIAAVTDRTIPHYKADFDMDEGLVTVRLTRIPGD